MTQTSSPAQIAYATSLRDNLADRFAAAETDPRWATELDQQLASMASAIIKAAANRYMQRKLLPWQQDLVPTGYTPSPENWEAAHAAIRPVIAAKRAAVRDTTDEQLAAMTSQEISKFIDTAKRM